MPKTYQSSRLTSGNRLFPDVLTLDDSGIDFTKKRLFGSNEEHMNYKAVASVKARNGLFFSTIVIESSGGSQPIVMSGVGKDEAKEIQATIKSMQQRC